jgi:hypothetical protein
MKHPASFFLPVIIPGLLAAALIVALVLFFDPLVFFLGSRIMGASPGAFRAALYIGAALVPVFVGALMALAVAALIKREDRKYEQILTETGDQVYDEFAPRLASIDGSILKLQKISEKIKQCREQLIELGRIFESGPGAPEPEPEGPETRSVTLGNAVVGNLRFVRQADEPVPPELSPLPQSHQKS